MVLCETAFDWGQEMAMSELSGLLEEKTIKYSDAIVDSVVEV